MVSAAYFITIHSVAKLVFVEMFEILIVGATIGRPPPIKHIRINNFLVNGRSMIAPTRDIINRSINPNLNIG